MMPVCVGNESVQVSSCCWACSGRCRAGPLESSCSHRSMSRH